MSEWRKTLVGQGNALEGRGFDRVVRNGDEIRLAGAVV